MYWYFRPSVSRPPIVFCTAVFAETGYSLSAKQSGRNAKGGRPSLKLRESRHQRQSLPGDTDHHLFETLLAFLIALALMFDPAFEFGQYFGDPLPDLASNVVTQRRNSHATPNQDMG